MKGRQKPCTLAKEGFGEVGDEIWGLGVWHLTVASPGESGQSDPLEFFRLLFIPTFSFLKVYPLAC